MSNEYVFEMKDITKAFGRNIVLDGVSISVRGRRLITIFDP